jgi:ferredoxin, 2Fe-2S
MVKIIIENLGQKELTVTDQRKTVLQHLHGNLIDWMHSCGGKGRCTTCKMIVLEGMEHLSELTPAELMYRKQGLLGLKERLSCQVRVNGDLMIRVPEEGKLPHVKYSN